MPVNWVLVRYPCSLAKVTHICFLQASILLLNVGKYFQAANANLSLMFNSFHRLFLSISASWKVCQNRRYIVVPNSVLASCTSYFLLCSVFIGLITFSRCDMHHFFQWRELHVLTSLLRLCLYGLDSVGSYWGIFLVSFLLFFCIFEFYFINWTASVFSKVSYVVSQWDKPCLDILNQRLKKVR